MKTETTFRAIPVHHCFEFPKPTDFPGPFQKTSARKYRTISGKPADYKVGSVNARVIYLGTPEEN